MITEDEYKKAIEDKETAQGTINKFHSEEQKRDEDFMEKSPVFKAKDLVFAATTKCDCGAGLAHPAGRTKWHSKTNYWDCSATLMGTADKDKKHCGHLPFAFYEIKSEHQPSAEGATTRPSNC